jgi:hypothetical protein
METITEIVVSKTAVVHGAGSDTYKWVSQIEPDIRRRLRNGDNIVVVTQIASRHYTQSGWKQIYYKCGRYYHREPTTTILAMLQKMLNELGE